MDHAKGTIERVEDGKNHDRDGGGVFGGTKDEFPYYLFTRGDLKSQNLLALGAFQDQIALGALVSTPEEGIVRLLGVQVALQH